MNDTQKTELLTKVQLDTLRKNYANVTLVDPDSSAMAYLRKLVAGFTPAVLRQVADAGIQWLSYLAKKQLEVVEAQEWRSFRDTPEGKAFLAARECAKDFGK